MNQPDPAAVRAALAEIDAWGKYYDIYQKEYRRSLVDNGDIIIAAAKAWLEQQDGNNQHTRGPVDCRGMKGASE